MWGAEAITLTVVRFMYIVDFGNGNQFKVGKAQTEDQSSMELNKVLDTRSVLKFQKRSIHFIYPPFLYL